MSTLDKKGTHINFAVAVNPLIANSILFGPALLFISSLDELRLVGANRLCHLTARWRWKEIEFGVVGVWDSILFRVPMRSFVNRHPKCVSVIGCWGADSGLAGFGEELGKPAVWQSTQLRPCRAFPSQDETLPFSFRGTAELNPGGPQVMLERGAVSRIFEVTEALPALPRRED